MIFNPSLFVVSAPFLWTDWNLWSLVVLWPQQFLLFEVSLVWCQPQFPDLRIRVVLLWRKWGSCYEAPPESSLDDSSISASLRCPPASPSRGSNLWLLQRPSSTFGLQSEEKPQQQHAQQIGLTWLETLTISFSSIMFSIVYYTVNIDIIFSTFVVISQALKAHI